MGFQQQFDNMQGGRPTSMANQMSTVFSQYDNMAKGKLY